jgi:hypothetical protein
VSALDGAGGQARLPLDAQCAAVRAEHEVALLDGLIGSHALGERAEHLQLQLCERRVKLSNARSVITSARTGEVAVTVAFLRASETSAISPKSSFPPLIFTRRPFLRTSTPLDYGEELPTVARLRG